MKTKIFTTIFVLIALCSCSSIYSVIPNYKRMSEYSKDLEYLSAKYEVFRDSIRVNKNKSPQKVEMFRDSARVVKSKARYRAKLNDFDNWTDFQYRYFVNRKQPKSETK